MPTHENKIDPCPDCPIPTNFIIRQGVSEGKKCLYVDCRECGDKWIEEIEND